MKKIAVFPGSFDPVTIGHVDIIERALPLFDELIIALGTNSQKRYLFNLEQRVEMVNKVFANEPKVRIDNYTGLTIEYCKNANASFILRGIRSSADFEFEKTIGQLNKTLAPDLESVFLISRPQFTHVSSSIVREIIVNKGDASIFMPEVLKRDFET